MSEQVKPASDHEYVQIPSHIENDETGEVIPFDGGEIPDGFTALFRYCQPASEQKPDIVPPAWTNLIEYVLQDDLHNRLTPRVVDIAYTAFILAKEPNKEDGGNSDWFNDTKPSVMAAIEKLREDLIEYTAPQPDYKAQRDIDIEAIDAAIAEALGEAYDCTRVWSAWSYGTMGPDDFQFVSEDSNRIAEIRDAILASVKGGA